MEFQGREAVDVITHGVSDLILGDLAFLFNIQAADVEMPFTLDFVSNLRFSHVLRCTHIAIQQALLFLPW